MLSVIVLSCICFLVLFNVAVNPNLICYIITKSDPLTWFTVSSHENHTNKIIVHSDSESVVNVVNGKASLPWKVRLMLNVIKHSSVSDRC